MPSHHEVDQRLEAAAVLREPVLLPCGATLPNRLAKAAMSEQLGTNSSAPDERIVRLYERFGASGAGLLITGNVMVDRRQLGEPHNVALENTSHLGVCRRWAEAGRAHGSQVWMQISHPGRQVPRGLAAHPLAPSAVPLRIAGWFFGAPRALSEDEILAVLGRFGRTARLAREAGFDGVQIQGAHGYLVSQFLSPRANRRDDRWGGSLENRMRFAREVVREVRREVGEAFPVGFKLNCSDFVRGGLGPEEALVVAAMLSDEGVDLIEVSGGGYESPAMLATRSRDPGREAFFLEFAGRLKGAIATPVMLTGGNRTASGMAAAVRSGAVDVVGLGRPMAVMPEFPATLLRGDEPGDLPGPRRLGVKAIDGFIQTSWHERQMHRLAAGREPAAHMCSYVTMAWALHRNTLGAAKVKRRLRLDGVV